jgi:hypothetical protein
MIIGQISLEVKIRRPILYPLSYSRTVTHCNVGGYAPFRQVAVKTGLNMQWLAPACCTVFILDSST